jgi:hypothetical protein
VARAVEQSAAVGEAHGIERVGEHAADREERAPAVGANGGGAAAWIVVVRSATHWARHALDAELRLLFAQALTDGAVLLARSQAEKSRHAFAVRTASSALTFCLENCS